MHVDAMTLLGQLPDSVFRAAVVLLAVWMWRLDRRLAVLHAELAARRVIAHHDG